MHLNDHRPASYFERIGQNKFRATEHVGGGWNPAEQHIAPAMGLLVHAIEARTDVRRDRPLTIGRLTYDILGTIPIGVVEVHVSVVRPGRTIELIEASLICDDRAALIVRAWLMQAYDTTSLAGSSIPLIEPPEAMAPWDPASIWPGGFVRTIETRRAQIEPGRAVTWLRTDVTLIDGEAVSPTARALGIIDIANGLTPRASVDVIAFPNVDLTAHLFRSPEGEWFGLDTTVSFGPNGVGLTQSNIHDIRGQVGTFSQCLTVRPR